MSGTFVLQEIRKSDEGTYWCSAVNSITGTTIVMPQNITLTVEDGPRTQPNFLASPHADVYARPGSTVHLECPGVGNPAPKAVWSRPEASIPSNRTSVLDFGLRIVDLTYTDRGSYTCRLDNGIGPGLIHTVRVELQEAPSIVRGPQRTLTGEGDRLELDCEVSGYPQPDIYWMINGVDVRLDMAVRVDGTRLVIKAVEKRHAGIVQCFAQNDVGEVNDSNLLEVEPKQVPGKVGSAPIGIIAHTEHSRLNHRRKQPRMKKKPKHGESFGSFNAMKRYLYINWWINSKTLGVNLILFIFIIVLWLWIGWMVWWWLIHNINSTEFTVNITIDQYFSIAAPFRELSFDVFVAYAAAPRAPTPFEFPQCRLSIVARANVNPFLASGMRRDRSQAFPAAYTDHRSLLTTRRMASIESVRGGCEDCLWPPCSTVTHHRSLQCARWNLWWMCWPPTVMVRLWWALHKQCVFCSSISSFRRIGVLANRKKKTRNNFDI